MLHSAKDATESEHFHDLYVGVRRKINATYVESPKAGLTKHVKTMLL